jgi:hypothetical protein
MYPISQERVQWLEGRIFILGRMINELRLRQARYQTRPEYAAQHPIVMQELVAEQMKLNIEKNCIEEYLAAESEANARRQAIEEIRG